MTTECPGSETFAQDESLRRNFVRVDLRKALLAR